MVTNVLINSSQLIELTNWENNYLNKIPMKKSFENLRNMRKKRNISAILRSSILHIAKHANEVGRCFLFISERIWKIMKNPGQFMKHFNYLELKNMHNFNNKMFF